MKTTRKLLSRIEEQEKKIVIKDMMALSDLKAVLDHRIDLRNTSRTLRSVLQG
jgi:hypothetical protein